MIDKSKAMECPIIDCRRRSDFENLHVKHSANIPAEHLFLRMHELPDKHVAFNLIVDDECVELVERFVEEKSLNINAIIHWQQCIDLKLEMEQGATQQYFWSPAPFIQSLVEQYLPTISLPNKSAVDIACGAGRDAVYLSLNGFNVTAIDHSETALQRCQLTAEQLGCRVATNCIDLEPNKISEADFNASMNPLQSVGHSFGLVTVCRYLHRPLLPYIDQLIAPGGVIAYHTFMVGSEKIGSPRNPKFLLKENELAEYFSGYTRLQNDVIQLPDGRPMAHFIAQKKQ